MSQAYHTGTMSAKPLAVAALLLVAGAVPVAASGAGSGTQGSSAYAGAHVSFETSSDAVVDYRVNGDTVMESVQVQARETGGTGGAIGADVGLRAVTSVDAAGVSVTSRTAASATVEAESGAELRAHDNPRGVLVVASGGEGQYVAVNLSESAETSQEDNRTVVVTSANGTEGTFLVVGGGRVTVNERGNLTAEIGEDGRLVYRAYPEGRSEADRRQERLVADGTATAEVYLTAARESGQQAGERAVEVVHYGQDTTVETTETARGRLEMTVDRGRREGTVLLTTLSEEAFGATDDVRVRVNGSAAAETSSYSELRAATRDGPTSRFLVRQSTSVSASADVLVAVNHFSPRSVTMADGGDATPTTTGAATPTETGTATADATATPTDTPGDGDGGGDDTGTSQPGFGLLAGLAALLAGALLARRG
jgi:PGF-CTERM protein